MARRSAHIPKTALSARKRDSLRRSDFAVPNERKYPINDLFHARLALTYVLTPSNAAYRDEVVDAVLARYPELKFWWAARSKRLAAPARRKVANPSHTSEEPMPVYTLNPSHRRAAKRKASSTPSLRERVAARRRNPEPKHLVLMPHRDYVAFRTSDGRTGSEPNMGPGKSGPTMALLLNRLGVLTENGMSPNWTVEVIKQEPSVLDTYLEGLPANRRRNGLSEDGMVVSNPAKRRSGGRAQKAGLAKGQSLMAQAAAAYRAGKYASMQDALRGVARGGSRKRNGLSEDGMVVSNPSTAHRIRAVKARRKNPRHEVETEAYFAAMEPTRAKYASRSPEELVLVRSRAAKMLRKFAGKSDREVAKALGLDPLDPAVLRQIALMREHAVVTNPAKRGTKRSGGRTAAQSNAAKAMKLFHSGKASSLAEAWDMVRRGR